MNDKIYPTMVIRSQAEAIELLEKENEKLKNIISSIKKDFLNANSELEEYKAKTDKAIEITNKIIDAGYDYNEVLTLAIKQLDVLQGSDKE